MSIEIFEKNECDPVGLAYNVHMANISKIEFRLKREERERFNAVWDRVLERTRGEGKISTVIRELIGWKPLKVLTVEEREYLSGVRASLPGDPKPPRLHDTSQKRSA